MALYHVQIEYRQVKTWYVEAETQDAVQAFLDSGDMEENHEPTVYSEDADIQAMGRVEGRLSRKFANNVVSIIPQDPEERT